MTWTPIVHKGFTAETFQLYVEGLPLNTAWRPRFVVVHNTGVPTIKEWNRHPDEEHMDNLVHYYRDIQHWHAGPHLFVAPDMIWAFTPLLYPGVHTPSWNRVSWGIETVGDFDIDHFEDPQKSLLVSALATLHVHAGLDPDTIKFHKEDPKTTHKHCPGHNMKKDELIKLVHDAIATEGEHLPDREL